MLPDTCAALERCYRRCSLQEMASSALACLAFPSERTAHHPSDVSKMSTGLLVAGALHQRHTCASIKNDATSSHRLYTKTTKAHHAAIPLRFNSHIVRPDLRIV